MERVWAVIDGDTITNTFVGDDAFADVMRAEHDEVVEITDVSPMPAIGWKVTDAGYRPEPPFPSWVWDVDYWRPPMPRPATGDYRWDEATQSWVEIDPAGS